MRSRDNNKMERWKLYKVTERKKQKDKKPHKDTTTFMKNSWNIDIFHKNSGAQKKACKNVVV